MEIPEVKPQNVTAMIPVPKADPKWQVRTRSAWDEFWKSDLARLADRRNEANLVLYRYFDYFDQWLSAGRSFKRQRVVKGSTGQSVANPAFKIWMTLDAAMTRIEKEMGLTMKQRLIFGLQAGRIRDELDDLNDSFEDDDDQDDEFEVPDGVVIIPAKRPQSG